MFRTINTQSNRKWTYTPKKKRKEKNNILSYTRASAQPARDSIVYIEHRWFAFYLCANFVFFSSSIVRVLLFFFDIAVFLMCVWLFHVHWFWTVITNIDREEEEEADEGKNPTKRTNWHKLWMRKKCRFQFSQYYKFFLQPFFSHITHRQIFALPGIAKLKTRNLLCAISLSYYNASIFPVIIFLGSKFYRQIIGACPV